MIWFDAIWCNFVWYGMIWYDMVENVFFNTIFFIIEYIEAFIFWFFSDVCTAYYSFGGGWHIIPLGEGGEMNLFLDESNIS